MDPTKSHYFESHVTIKPVSGDRLVRFREISREGRFNVATFSDDSAGPDSMICTGRNKSYEELERRMFGIVRTLVSEGFTVTRYKIESTILDSRMDDGMFPLKVHDGPPAP